MLKVKKKINSKGKMFLKNGFSGENTTTTVGFGIGINPKGSPSAWFGYRLQPKNIKLNEFKACHSF